MKARAVLLTAIAGLAVGMAHAQAAPPMPSVSVDSDSSDGSVGVGSSFDGNPLVGARYNTNSGVLCAGVSYQVPQCVVVGGGR